MVREWFGGEIVGLTRLQIRKSKTIPSQTTKNGKEKKLATEKNGEPSGGGKEEILKRKRVGEEKVLTSKQD